MEIDKEIKQLSDFFFVEHEGQVYHLLVDSLEKPLIERVLRLTGGNQLKTAKILGINRNTLRVKLKKLGIFF